jgi:hypothetical protein
MKNLLLLSVLAFLGFISKSQNPIGEIRGTICDSITKETLPDAHVFVLTGSDSIAVTTNLEGDFVVKGIKAGYYNLKVSFMGYQTKLLTGVQVIPGQVKFLGKVLLSQGIELKGVVVETAGRKMIDPDEPSAIVLLPCDILKSPIQREITKLVAVSVPGILVSDNGKEVHFRGSRDGAEAYYIDGVKVPSLEGYPSQAIGSIKVFTGGVPAQYGDLTGGVISIETKSYFDLYNDWLATHPE